MKTLFATMVALITLTGYAQYPGQGSYNLGSGFFGGAIYVSTNGNDVTGSRGNLNLPFATPKAAVAAAQAGDTVVEFPGTYTDQNNLGKNWVNIYMYPGATNIYIDRSTNGVGTNLRRGFIDDRDGVLNVVVSGKGTWIYSEGTNIANFDTNGFVWNTMTNTMGAVVLTNYASSLRWESGDCYYGALALISSPFFNVVHSTYNTIKVDDMYDLYWPSVDVDTIVFGVQQFSGTARGFYWNSGESYFTFEHIHHFGGANSFWWDEQISTHTNFEGEAWITGHLIEDKIYLSGVSSTWRTWSTVSEVKTSGEQCWSISGPGKHYIFNQKSETTTAQPVLTMGTVTAKDALTVWFFSQALKSGSSWINVGGGTLIANVLNFEDTGANGGTVNDGIFVPAPDGNNSNAFINVTGQTLTANNGHPITLLGGTNIFTGLTVRSTNNTCAFVTGGYNLFNGCLLISKTTSNSIDSALTAVNVGLIGGMQNHAKGANVTIQPGTAVVDTNLK